MHIHGILGTDSIMFCDSLCYFTMSFDGFSFKDVAGCFNKKRDRAVYYWVLTEINDKSIMQNDKRSCHYNNEGCQIDNKSCHMEVWYDTAKSSEGTQGCARCQSAGDGKTVRSVKADNQSYRKGRLFAISQSCINDCKSMRSYRGRSILFTGGR